MRFRHPFTIAALALITITTPGCKFILVPTYSVEKIPRDDVGDAWKRFNNATQILGTSVSDEDDASVAYWQDGQIFPVSDFFGTDIQVMSMIQPEGLLTNFFVELDGAETVIPSIWNGGSLDVVVAPAFTGGDYSIWALDRSEGGRFIGIYVLPPDTLPNRYGLITWNQSGDFTLLDSPVEPFRPPLIARGIFVNDNGMIVARVHPNMVTVWTSANSTPRIVYEPEGAVQIAVSGISEDNVICGYSAGISGKAWAIIENEISYLKGTLSGESISMATGINSNSEIVGIEYGIDLEVWHVLKWRWNTVTHQYDPIRISDLMKEKIQPNEIPYSVSINDKGEIVIWTFCREDEVDPNRTYLLKPSSFTLYDSSRSVTVNLDPHSIPQSKRGERREQIDSLVELFEASRINLHLTNMN